MNEKKKTEYTLYSKNYYFRKKKRNLEVSSSQNII